MRDTVLVMLVQSPVDLPDLIVTAVADKPLRYAGTTKYDDFFCEPAPGDPDYHLTVRCALLAEFPPGRAVERPTRSNRFP